MNALCRIGKHRWRYRNGMKLPHAICGFGGRSLPKVCTRCGKGGTERYPRAGFPLG